MKWASSSSGAGTLTEAIDECVRELLHQLGGTEPDLVIVFVSPHHGDDYARIPEAFGARFPDATLIGCTAGGTIGGGRELEHSKALSVTAASLPDVQLHPFALDAGDVATIFASPLFIRRSIDLPEDSEPSFLLLPDPFSMDTERLLDSIDTAWPGSTTLGGLASGGTEPGEHALFLNENVHPEGCVGLALTGNIRLDTIVAQGCRPVGNPMRVTDCRGNLLIGLDDLKPTEALSAVYHESSEDEQQLMRSSIFLGIALQDEDALPLDREDFLIRNVLGMDPEHGVLSIGAMLTRHQRVQFHVRDRLTSQQDLGELLESHSPLAPGAALPAGALLFSCLGRGYQLYGEADHDTRMFHEHIGPVPLGGFFCNGEIGPVQGRPFVHGFTSVFGLFRPRD